MTLCGRLLPSGSTLLDVGCGQGLMLALLADARRAFRAGQWPAHWPTPPQFDRMVGIEIRPRVAHLARRALSPDAEIVEGDARENGFGSCRVILAFDVLHMMPRTAQDALLTALGGALDAGGVMLVREADPSAGWRFATVKIGNRLKAVLSGASRQRFHFRTVPEWLECFTRLGLVARVEPTGRRTPFANVLFHVTRRAAAGS